MNFVPHFTNNFTYTTPPGLEADCGDLPVTVHDTNLGRANSSFWLPSLEELLALNRGEHVMLTIYGAGHPVVSIGVTP